MYLNRQSVRIPKEGHLPACKGISPDRLTGDSFTFQLRHHLVYTGNAKSNMPQAIGFRVRDACRPVFHDEELKFGCRIDGKIDLPVFPFRPVILPDDGETELDMVEFQRGILIGADDEARLNFRSPHHNTILMPQYL